LVYLCTLGLLTDLTFNGKETFSNVFLMGRFFGVNLLLIRALYFAFVGFCCSGAALVALGIVLIASPTEARGWIEKLPEAIVTGVGLA